MKSAIIFIGTTIRMVVISIAISFIFYIINIAYNFVVGCKMPPISKFIYGAIPLFIFHFLYSVFTTALTLYRYHKDPVFKEVNMKIGLSWREYKELKKKIGKD